MRARVLLVGPSDPQFEELQVALERAGYLTQTADNGIDGLVVGCEFRPHLVITEVLLSGMNGLEFSSSITKAEGFNTQVILYTQSYRDEKSRREALNRHGALYYFVKPFQRNVLWKAVTELLNVTDLQNGKVAVSEDQEMATLQKSGKQQIPGRPMESSSRLEPSAIDTNLTKMLAPAADQFPPSVRHPRKQNGPLAILENSSGSEASEPELQLSETAAMVQEVSCSITPENKMKSDSEPKKKRLQPEIDPAAKIQPEFPPSAEPSKVSAIQIPGEPVLAPLRKLPVFRRTQVLIGGIVIIGTLGFSLAPQFWTSRLDRPVVSVQTLDFPQSSENQTSSPNDDKSESSAAPAALKQPTESDAEASGAMIQLLKNSELNQSTVDPDSSFTHADQQQPRIRDSLVYKSPSSSSSVQLMISDISPTERQPFLATMIHPSLSDAELRAMGTRPYLISLEMDEWGTVTSARLLTPGGEDSFPVSILDTVRQWRFVPRDKSQQGSWMKYFSFKATPISEQR
jgi:DNA-binding response OmpR family regulator